jgi:ATP-dependent RNA helicase RhlE
LLRALGTKGYSEATPIQTQAIPAVLTGRDLLGIAQTGTGKTAAFSLPSLHRLLPTQGAPPASCRMLVLSADARTGRPDRREHARLCQVHCGLSVQCMFGGVPVGKQARACRRADILVATPGRLLDLIDQRALTLRKVEIFVLDEADQMMDLGFIQCRLKRIAAMLPKERQSLFFSATMPKAIADLGKQFINNPVRVEVSPQATTAERVEQYVIFVNQAEKQALLTISLRAGPEGGRNRTHAGLHPHQARRRPGRAPPQHSRRQGRRDPRQQEPGPAHRRAAMRSARAPRRCWSPPTSPHAAST